ncbi:MAG: hypothetical protein IPP17_03430 [Bacteroidetes bacterium]|nr:hypothetical protein [Bacteroidota bacterium]
MSDNPVPKEHWGYTQSIKMLEKFFEDQMFPMTVGGLTEAMKKLKKG